MRKKRSTSFFAHEARRKIDDKTKIIFLKKQAEHFIIKKYTAKTIFFQMKKQVKQSSKKSR